jgi:hypothetical protein
MKKHRTVGLIVAVVILVAVAVAYALWPRKPIKPAERVEQPIYQGKGLSRWVTEASGIFSSQDERARAREALRQIGTNALPFLLQSISDFETPAMSPFDKTIAKLEKTAGLNGDSPGAAFDRTWRTIFVTTAFNVLGPSAYPAVPALTNLLSNPPASYMAAAALASMDPPVISPLTNALKNPNPEIRANVAAAFAEMGSNAIPVIDCVVKCAKDTDPDVRISATKTLGNIGKHKPEAVVPILIECLTDANTLVRRFAAGALSNLGDKAKPAVPALLKAINDPNRYVRSNAKFALKKIDPEAAKVVK